MWEPFSSYNCLIYSEEVFVSTAEGQGGFGFLLCPLLTGSCKYSLAGPHSCRSQYQGLKSELHLNLGLMDSLRPVWMCCIFLILMGDLLLWGWVGSVKVYESLCGENNMKLGRTCFRTWTSSIFRSPLSPANGPIPLSKNV